MYRNGRLTKMVPPKGERVTTFTDVVVAERWAGYPEVDRGTWTRKRVGKRLFRLIGLCISSGGSVDYRQDFETHGALTLERATVTLNWSGEGK